MAFKVSATYCIPRHVILAALATVVPLTAVCGHRATCDNEVRPANRKACDGQIFGQLVPYPGDCGKFLVCNWENPTVKLCPDGLWFDNELKVCNYPQFVNCTNIEETEITAPNLKTSPFTTSTTEPRESTSYFTPPMESTPLELNTQSSTSQADLCITPVGVVGNICSEAFRRIYQFYPYNCSAYIKCQGATPCVQYCARGKIFNAILGICDENIECQETTSSTTTQIPATPSTTTGVSSSLPAFVDPSLCQDKKDYTVFSYEENCNRYLLCENGEVKFERCPDGWFFNAKLKLCDEAADQQCADDVVTTTEASAATTAATTGTVNNFCLNQPAGKTFPNRENCQWYYYCRGNGSYYMISCPFANFYDPKTGNCGTDVQAQACARDNNSILTPQERCASAMSGSTFAYEENCSKYIFCKGNGEFTIISCPYNNYYYPHTGNCGPSTDANICRDITATTAASQTTTLSLYEGICNDNYTGQLMPYPDNSEKYISCVRPIAIAFYCPNSWQFNEKQQKCIKTFAGNSTTLPITANDICLGHKEGSLQVNADNCQLYYECMTEDGYMMKACNQGKYFDPINRLCSAHVGSDSCWHYTDSTSAPATAPPFMPPAKEICRDVSPGNKFNYPDNCTKYILCEQPIPQSFVCASGLLFSYEKQTCVVATESDCRAATTSTAIPSTFRQCAGKHDFTFLPHENDCSMFILCYQHVEHLAYCQDGEYFDRTLDKCSATANKSSCLSDVITQTRNSTTLEPDLGLCSNQPEGTKIPYPHNCIKYIECHEPLSLVYDCPQGFEFSRQQQECVLPELSLCGTTQQTSLSSTALTPAAPIPETCQHKLTGSSIAYTPDCSKYYTCIKGREKLTNCMPNSYYNPLTGQCDYSTSPNACTAAASSSITVTTTAAEMAAQDPCHNNKNGFMLANQNSCHQYFICFEENAIRCICPFKHFYNSQQEECQWETSGTICQKSKTTTTEASEITPAKSTTPLTIQKLLQLQPHI